MTPQPITLSYAWGSYTIRIAGREAKSFDPFEVLTFFGMTDVQARSAMQHAVEHPGEQFNFSWKLQCPA